MTNFSMPDTNRLSILNIQWEEFWNRSYFSDVITYVFAIPVSKSFQEIKYEGVLSQTEIDKSTCFLHEGDRKSYLVRKYFLRMLLSKIGNLHPQKIEFSFTENKKPTSGNIEFNVSHSHDMVIIAISPGRIGIDVEYVKENFDFSGMLTACFCEQEIAHILDGNGIFNFYKLWTRKEALLKATGEGLTENLPFINCLPDVVTRNESSFKIVTLEIQENYLISIALDKQESEHLVYLRY
jgi:4'-phosphopantetheinyl transferase